MTESGVSTLQLIARLERVECEQKRKREEEHYIPLRRQELKHKKYWVRRLMRRYLRVLEFLYGCTQIRYLLHNSSSNNKIWEVPDIELQNLCLDIKLAIESLAWTDGGRFETCIGSQMRQVFILKELEGQGISTITRIVGLSKHSARALWERAVEQIWESLGDYDERRIDTMKSRRRFRTEKKSL